MQYFSDDRQDEFCANILKFKRNGFYVDIGSGASVGSNNSYFFESLGWEGICVEKNPVFKSSYEKRTCIFVNDDALMVDYEYLFGVSNAPMSIDYLSIDIDEQSTKVLEVLPLDKYRFKVITIEHDSHFYGDTYKIKQREILKANGYFLLCEDVLNQSGRNISKEHEWEDWHIDPSYFDDQELIKLYSYRLNTEEIINKFK